MIAVTTRRLATIGAGLMLSCAALAQTAAPDAAPLSPMPRGPGMMGRGAGQMGPIGPHGMGPHHGGANFLRGLNLTEAQRDKIFAIEYAQMPEAREQRKAIDHARRDLRAMVVSGQYDEARAHALTDALGRAVAREAQLRAQAGVKIMQVLTPEQRRQVGEREAAHVAELDRVDGAPDLVPM
ncbi:MAG: Spy/CpxP family protein refolding chaperone [Burkholderiaceae bacterium]|nr:Spy/CpxP family protein refolding chaperone [Burkholderiaceae bacterium]